MSKKKPPSFNNIEEMAEFWDEHDTTEYNLGEPEAVIYQPRSVVMTVRFDPGDMLTISRQARRLGLDKSSFIRMAVKQYLQNQ
jgi:predicted DNA binding CopG/RHH family protein